MKHLKFVAGIAFFALSVFANAQTNNSDDLKRLGHYSNQMKTIPYEIGPLKDPSSLPFKVGEPVRHKKEIETWLKENNKRYKAGSFEMLGDPVLIRFRDQVGYGVCAQISGDQVFAGYNGSVFYLFLFNGDLMIDIKNQTMLLGMNEVDDARVRLLNAEIDHGCIAIVSSGLNLNDLENPKNPTNNNLFDKPAIPLKMEKKVNK